MNDSLKIFFKRIKKLLYIQHKYKILFIIKSRLCKTINYREFNE